jgi:hypothetical protein
MAQFKFKSMDILISLAALLERHAQAVNYALARSGEITLDLPDDDGGQKIEKRYGQTCPPVGVVPSPTGWLDRANAEILLGVLKLMTPERQGASGVKGKPGPKGR